MGILTFSCTPSSSFLPHSSLSSHSQRSHNKPFCASNKPRNSRSYLHTVHSAISPPDSQTPTATLHTHQNHQQLSTPSEYPSPSPVAITAQRQSIIQRWKSVPEMWQELSQSYPAHNAIIDNHCKQPTTLTFHEMNALITEFAAGLLQLGIQSNQSISLFSENSHRWLIADMAVMKTGSRCAVRGTAAPKSELEFIYNNSESTALIVESQSVLDSVVPSLANSTISFIVVLFPDAASSSADSSIPIYTFDQMISLGQSYLAAASQPEPFPALRGDDICTLIYTSGTTGNPKGVCLTHSNLLHQMGCLSIGNVDTVPGDIFVTVLPCWHIFQRTAEYFVLSRAGCLVYSDKKHFRADLLQHKPHILVGVPRLFENLYNSVISKTTQSATTSKFVRNLVSFLMLVSYLFVYAKRTALDRSLEASDSRSALLRFARKVRSAVVMVVLWPLYSIANVLVWKKVREGVGGRVKEIICGGGRLAMMQEDFFEAAGLNIFVGYGLTETSPVICNRFAERCVRGSAGLPPPGTQVCVVDVEDEEKMREIDANENRPGLIMVRGPQVTKGYWKNPEATRKAFNKNGYFDTGDLGYFGEGGDLVITGRMKDVIVLSSGENVEPGPLEESVCESEMVDQIVIVGQDEKSLGALVVLSEGVLDGKSEEEVEKVVLNEVRRKIKERKNYNAVERIGKIKVLKDAFTVENGMMTQTLKIKRDVVTKRYAKEIEQLFK